MNNPYESPIAQQTLPPPVVTNPTYRIEQLEKRFNRLRWCTAIVYLVAVTGHVGSLGPLELLLALIALPAALFATRC